MQLVKKKILSCLHKFELLKKILHFSLKKTLYNNNYNILAQKILKLKPWIMAEQAHKKALFLGDVAPDFSAHT